MRRKKNNIQNEHKKRKKEKVKKWREKKAPEQNFAPTTTDNNKNPYEKCTWRLFFKTENGILETNWQQQN